MSVASTAPPRCRSRWWWLLLVLPVLFVPALVGALLSEGPDEPGKRTKFVFPGGAWKGFFGAGGLKLELAPELCADNILAELGTMSGSMEQKFVFRREVSQHQIFVTAGNQPLRSSDLHFTLIDQAGAEISAGVLWPEVELQPNVKTSLIIGDFELGRAVKIILSKAGK